MRALRRSLAVCLTALVAACGARTGLPVSGEEQAGGGTDGSRESDSVDDAGGPRSHDALPPIDVTSPVDSTSECPDASSTLVYVISSLNTLMSFYPPTATFTTIGRVNCPAPTGFAPFSMAVDRTGIAYVLFSDYRGTRNPGVPAAELFRVSTATASCQATRFVGGQGFAPTFGMAYARDTAGGGETLYVAEGSQAIPCAARLASIDANTFALTPIGTIAPPVCSPELTGTGAGDLFGFYAVSASDSAIGQIRKTTAQLTNESRLNGLAQTGPFGGSWAFAFWGGDFYTFTAPDLNAGSVVTRFRPSDGSIVQVGPRTPEPIVGAGVSTCAPQR